MTDITVGQNPPKPAPVDAPAHSYLDTPSLWSWLATTEHKRIAILYAITVTFFFLIGSGAMAVIRLELMTPQADVVSDEAYNRLFTLHGVVMVWFFLIPSIPTIFGNFLIPLMIGAKDLAFPRLNLISWYLNLLGGLFVIYVLISGGVDTGWTFYTPYSTMFANGAVIAAAAGVFFAGFSSIAARACAIARRKREMSCAPGTPTRPAKMKNGTPVTPIACASAISRRTASASAPSASSFSTMSGSRDRSPRRRRAAPRGPQRRGPRRNKRETGGRRLRAASPTSRPSG